MVCSCNRTCSGSHGAACAVWTAAPSMLKSTCRLQGTKKYKFLGTLTEFMLPRLHEFLRAPALGNGALPPDRGQTGRVNPKTYGMQIQTRSCRGRHACPCARTHLVGRVGSLTAPRAWVIWVDGGLEVRPGMQAGRTEGMEGEPRPHFLAAAAAAAGAVPCIALCTFLQR
jgi:hypothetical protein